MPSFKLFKGVPRVLKNVNGMRPEKTAKVTLLGISTTQKTARLRIEGAKTREDTWCVGDELCVMVGGEQTTLKLKWVAGTLGAASPNGKATVECLFQITGGTVTNANDDTQTKKTSANPNGKQTAVPTKLTSFEIHGLVSGEVVTLWDHGCNAKAGTDVRIDEVDYNPNKPEESRVTITRVARGTSVTLSPGDTIDVIIHTPGGFPHTRAHLTLTRVYSQTTGSNNTHFICVLLIENVTQCSATGSFSTIHTMP